MSVIGDIFTEYVRMRENGLDTREALRALRAYVEPLPRPQKEELAQRLRAWERNQRKQAAVTRSMPVNDSDSNEDETAEAPATRSQEMPAVTVPQGIEIWLECPNCHAKNRQSEVFCYACGHLLESDRGEFDTRHFAEATGELFSYDYFGPDSVLLLNIRDSEYPAFELRPQLRQTELVIGRSAGNSAMVPDVDMAGIGGEEKGVSRLHLSLKYVKTDNAIQIFDLGSANGSYVNGQKLHPREVRILRNGDELRLGRLVLRVAYQHPGEELD